MTVDKDDVEAGTVVQAVVKATGVAPTEDNKSELMTDSKLPDDWSIVGSKSLDNEGSDGESVEVIPCEEEVIPHENESEEEKLEESDSADSDSAVSTSPSELPIQTRENIMQTEEVARFPNFTLWHPCIVVLSVVCHLLITLVFYSAPYSAPDPAPKLVNNDPCELPVTLHDRQLDGLLPETRALLTVYELFSSRSDRDKAHIINFLKYYFPFDKLDKFNDEVISLLEKDLGEESEIMFNILHNFRHRWKRNHRRAAAAADELSEENPPPPDQKAENAECDCRSCKKCSSECRRICKPARGPDLNPYGREFQLPIKSKISRLHIKY